MMTAVYLRVSSRQQEVDAQKHRIKAWLKGRGLVATEWYIDKMSGTTMVRPEFAKLQRAIFNGEVSQVVMYSLDRFSRSMVDGLVELDRWQKQRVKVTFVDDQLELEFGTWAGDVMAKLMVSMKLAFAEAENERRASRQADGIRAALERGQTWGGSSPGRRKVNPNRIAELRGRGLRNKEIAAALGVSLRTVVRRTKLA